MAIQTKFVLLTILIGCFASALALEYSGPGPCTSTVTTLDVKLPKEYICKCQCSARLVVTVPAEGCAYQGPFPTVLFTSGFQATSKNYKAYADRLSSWGFAVVQYDFLNISPWIDGLCHSDAAEAGFMLKFLEALRETQADASSPLAGKLDLSNLGTAGHSRGGKIAALHYAGTTPDIKAAYLVDPIDGFALTKGHLGYPSATMLLKDRSKRIGITGAGRIGACNGAPFATGNWTKFWEVAPVGSELQVVMNAGHLQFVDIHGAWDNVCCTGCMGLMSQEATIDLTLMHMVSWFQKELRSVNADVSLVDSPDFNEWMCEQEAAHKLTYVVRGRDALCPGGRRQRNKSIHLFRIDSHMRLSRHG